MVDVRKVIKDDAQAGLELLTELPRARDGGRRVVEDIADEMQSGDFARNGCAFDEQGGDDDIGYLRECVCSSTDMTYKGKNDSEPRLLPPRAQG